MKFVDLQFSAVLTLSMTLYKFPVCPVLSGDQWVGVAIPAFFGKGPSPNFGASVMSESRARNLGQVACATESEVTTNVLDGSKCEEIQRWLRADDNDRALTGMRILKIPWNQWLASQWDSGLRSAPIPPEELRLEMLRVMPTEIVGPLYDSVTGGYWSRYIAKSETTSDEVS